MIVAFAWIPLNAFAPTVFLERYGVFIVMFLKFLQLKNACLPIFLILDEITTLFIDENSNGEINIKAENEDKGEEISTPDSPSEERKKLVKILNEYI